MDIGQIIQLAGYVVGVIIIIRFQNQKIKSLTGQVESQKGILESVERFMNIFKIDDIEKYVEMTKKKMTLEQEEEIKTLEDKHMSKFLKAFEAAMPKISKKMSEKVGGQFIFELGQMGILLMSLFTHLNFDERIIKEWIPKIKDGLGKDTALMAYEISQENFLKDE